MRYTVPVTVTITATSEEEAKEITTTFMTKVLPAYKPFSATYAAEVGNATPRVEASAEATVKDLSAEDAEAFNALAETLGAEIPVNEES